MADYSFEDAAKPYLDWVASWKKENRGFTYRQFVKDLVDHLDNAQRYFRFPSGTQLTATKTFVVLQFPKSPVHLTIPREPAEPGIETSRHFTVHITDETPEDGFRYREFYRFDDLKSVARDNPSKMPIGFSSKVGESARQRGTLPTWATKQVPPVPAPAPKGGKTRRRRMRRRRTVRSK